MTNDSNGVFQIPSELFDYMNDLHVENLTGSDGEVNGAFAVVGNNNHGIDIHGENNEDWDGSLLYDGDNLGDPGLVEITALDTEAIRGVNQLTGDGIHTVLVGSEGHDHIQGSVINEIITGGQDTAGDQLFGGGGNDILFASGKSELTGEEGDDTFYVPDVVKGVDILDFTAGEDNVDLSNLGVADGAIHINDDDLGTASVTVDGTDLGITIHYVGDITFDLLDGVITATVDV